HPSDLNNNTEPARVTASRVLVLVYDPIMEWTTGRKLSEQQDWQRVEDLASGFMRDISAASGGFARYQIAQRIDLSEFPASTDGFRHTPQSYMEVLRGMAPPHVPREADYVSVLKRFRILERVARKEIDEVWIFAFPQAGFYGSTMGGPGAFWCNAPPLRNTDASLRRFVVMGFSVERNVGDMLEAFGHRAESIMQKVYSPLSGEENLWNRFARYDMAAPGQAAVGTVHFAPNSRRDYEWENASPVMSECYDWLNNFPDFKNDIRPVEAQEWGGGAARLHHQWWLNHIPRRPGRRNGILHNWWPYIIDPDRAP
ncbi:MAG: hypothetical protein ACM3QS_04315, partial [Bacteroidota bacterium]